MNQDLKQILTILEKLMNCPSVSEDKKTTDKLIDDIAKMMPNNLFIKKHIFDGYSSIVISNTKDKDFDIVFCGHIDVVPCEQYKYIKKGNIVYGRGSIDMKGAVAVCIHLFQNLKTDKKVALFITSDEEIAGNCAKQLVELYPNIRLAVIPDGGKDFKLIIEEKGLLQLKLKVKTKSAHASQPYNGINAIETLYECYKKLLKKYPLPQNQNDYKTSINLSSLNSGDAINKVPDYAEMILDIRYTKDTKEEEILKQINQINKTIETEIIGSGPLFIANPENENIKSYLKICKEILGHSPEITKTESTSDAIYFSEKNIPTVLMNPVGNYPHCKEEYVEIDSLLKLYKIYKTLVEEGVIKCTMN